MKFLRITENHPLKKIEKKSSIKLFSKQFIDAAKKNWLHSKYNLFS